MINCYGTDCSAWRLLHPRATFDMLGYVPMFLEDTDTRPAREQFEERYEYGGWRPNEGFSKDDKDFITYPGDPALPPIAERMVGDERVVMYPCSLFAIIQPDGSFEVARLD